LPRVSFWGLLIAPRGLDREFIPEPSSEEVEGLETSLRELEGGWGGEPTECRAWSMPVIHGIALATQDLKAVPLKLVGDLSEGQPFDPVPASSSSSARPP
jgi:hypothetical protein